jgi:Tfp pilus assembly protein PilX
MFAWVAAVKGWPAPPTLNIDLLWVVITGMLGIGGLRTYEKKQRLSK